MQTTFKHGALRQRKSNPISISHLTEKNSNKQLHWSVSMINVKVKMIASWRELE